MVKNKTLIRRLRKTTIKIDFYERQISYLEELKTTNLEEKLLYIGNHTNKKVEEQIFILNTVDKFKSKRDDKISKFTNKLYWQRRRFKQKNRNLENLDSLLESFDQEQTNQTSKYENDLLEKYPILNYSNEEKEKAQEIISDLEKLKENKINKYKESNDKFVARTNSKISKKTTKIEKLEKNKQQTTEKIINQNSLALDKIRKEVKVLEENIKTLETTTQNEKEILKLKNKVAFHNAYIETNENENIHLSVTNLKMHFGGIKALDGVSFNVKKGEIFGLIGPNGAGKTTVFNCITQFYSATDGNMLFKNKEGNISDISKISTHNIIKEGIARSFQNIEMVWELSVLDNLLVAAHSNIMSGFLEHMIHSKRMREEEKVIRQKGMNILQLLEIEEYAFRSPYGLPYGVLKKVELARTLMTSPTMIILDEPAAGLNDVETQDLAKTIKKINEELNVTIFLVEHDMQLVMSISDTVCAINFGKMLAIGTPKEIQSNEDVRTAYLGDD